MPIFNQPIIRCALFPDDVRANNNFITQATGATPGMYSGEQVEFQFALFKAKASGDNPAVLYDISNFSGNPKMRIRSASASGTILLDETVSGCVIEKDPSLDVASWNDGSKWHFRFYFPETATGITAGDTHYIVVYGPDGDVFGRSVIYVVDPGTGLGSSPTPGDAAYYTKNDVNGILGDFARKIGRPNETFALTTQDGKFRIIAQAVNDADGPHIVWNTEQVVNVQP